MNSSSLNQINNSGDRLQKQQGPSSNPHRSQNPPVSFSPAAKSKLLLLGCAALPSSAPTSHPSSQASPAPFACSSQPGIRKFQISLHFTTAIPEKLMLEKLAPPPLTDHYLLNSPQTSQSPIAPTARSLAVTAATAATRRPGSG